MASMMDGDPTELVSCGKCTSVNTVPFGLDKFKCYKCNALVAVAREPSAACAAASATAQYYNELEATSTVSGSTASTAASQSLDSSAKKKTAEVGFFGKLQKTMDKTMAKMDKTFSNLTAPKPQESAPAAAPAQTVARPTQRPSGAPQLSSEEEQLQWALNASLGVDSTPPPAGSTAVKSSAMTEIIDQMDDQLSMLEGTKDGPAAAAAASPTGIMMGKPPGSSAPASAPAATAGANPGDQLQAMASQVASRLQRAEERAARAESELATIQNREASAVAERASLQQQLAENESLIRGLTEQLDLANTQLEEKSKQCRALEDLVVTAQQAAADAAEASARQEQGFEGDNLERQGTIAQLLTRIAELESTLLCATHFAPEADKGESAGDDSAAAPAVATSTSEAAPDEVPSATGTVVTDKAAADSSADQPAKIEEVAISTDTELEATGAGAVAAAVSAAPAAAVSAAPAVAAQAAAAPADTAEVAAEPQAATGPDVKAASAHVASGPASAAAATVQPAPEVNKPPDDAEEAF